MKTKVQRMMALALAGLTVLAMQRVQANNIQVTNTGLINNGTTAQVLFNLSWENSWRTISAPANWDAAWVFVKYRTGAGMWNHANLANTGNGVPGGNQLVLGLLTPGNAYNASTNPALGAFIYRGANGSGTLTLNSTQLRWDYSALGLAFSDIAQVQVFAIEMVYVPQGDFAAGHPGAAFPGFTTTTINTANATTAPAGIGSLGGQAGGYPTGQVAPASATWPNGFGAFYSMKYEMSQQGYADFLNTLTYTQQVTRTATAPTSAAGTGALRVDNFGRQGIDIQTPGVASTTPAIYACNFNGNGVYGEATDGKDIACNWLSWGDLTAYLDWSGLRPMTELEFEKACRGPLAPSGDIYPWGTTSLTVGFYTLANAGASNEGIATNYSTTQGNMNYNNTSIGGPTRVGIFAANGSNSGRVTAGAGYYGIMELGGNLFERPVTIGNANGRAFTGTHGNGALAAGGDPDGATWPAPTTADGSGFRSGYYGSPDLRNTISFRSDAYATSSTRSQSNGGRGARLAP